MLSVAQEVLISIVFSSLILGALALSLALGTPAILGVFSVVGVVLVVMVHASGRDSK